MKTILIASLLLAAAPNARSVEMSVTNKGFDPARIEVKKGEPVHLVVTRKTDGTCAKELVIKDESSGRIFRSTSPWRSTSRLTRPERWPTSAAWE